MVQQICGKIPTFLLRNFLTYLLYHLHHLKNCFQKVKMNHKKEFNTFLISLIQAIRKNGNYHTKITKTKLGTKSIMAIYKAKGREIAPLFMRPHTIAVSLYCFLLISIVLHCSVVGCPV